MLHRSQQRARLQEGECTGTHAELVRDAEVRSLQGIGCEDEQGAEKCRQDLAQPVRAHCDQAGMLSAPWDVLPQGLHGTLQKVSECETEVATLTKMAEHQEVEYRTLQEECRLEVQQAKSKSLALSRSAQLARCLQAERDEAICRAAEHEAEATMLRKAVINSEVEQRSLRKLRQDDLTELREASHERLALGALKEQLKAMQLERDEAVRRVSGYEAELQALRQAVEHARDIQSSKMADACQSENIELQETKLELARVSQELASSRAEVWQLRSKSDEWRDRCEHLLAEDSRNSRKTEEQHVDRRDSEFGDALYRCLRERVALLEFVTELLTELQLLFKGNAIEAYSDKLESGERERGRSHSEHRHRGCFACVGACPAGCVRRRSPSRRRETRELLASLEAEVSFSLEELTSQIDFVRDTAKEGVQILGLPVSVEHNLGEPCRHSVLQACLRWVETERRRREVGIPRRRQLSPAVDWAAELARYQTAGRALRTHSGHLAALRRVLRASRSDNRGCKG